MDVSNKKELPAAAGYEEEAPTGPAGPSGEELIQQLVSASGLPEAAVHSELSEICAVAGQDPGNMTLDQLRAAMLTYLEQLEASAQETEG